MPFVHGQGNMVRLKFAEIADGYAAESRRRRPFAGRRRRSRALSFSARLAENTRHPEEDTASS